MSILSTIITRAVETALQKAADRLVGTVATLFATIVAGKVCAVLDALISAGDAFY